ncbi:type VII secretion system-associated protein [Streptomyces sp. 13-12-16]|uniref:type VII secretion system-associated protein n=1 Tax=Streptomyces sp. 13-12-16 TaxID=1570823 RepID=UPI002119E48D|nr:type VII secretion system-associated protein [Streptomyces sp. 13-12-16]
MTVMDVGGESVPAKGTTERGGTAVPTPPDDIVEAARLAPDHWISMIDPGWDGEGVPPDRVVVGRWRTGPTGEIEEWEDNEAYRPSPESLGWPEPTDDVDEALQLAVTGYGPAEDVLRALATAEVAVLTLPDGSLVTAAVEDGGLVVPVFTASPHLNAVGGFAFDHVTVPALLDRLPPGHALYVNPAGPAGSVLESDQLAETIADGKRPADTPGPPD